jgi:hypothetical protein
MIQVSNNLNTSMKSHLQGDHVKVDLEEGSMKWSVVNIQLKH